MEKTSSQMFWRLSLQIQRKMDSKLRLGGVEFWASKKLGLSTVDIFTVDISTLEPTQYNKFLINIQILESSK